VPTGVTKRVNRFQPKAEAGGNYVFRFNAARPWVENRTVLDIGASRSFRTLHRLIDEVADHTVAVDLDETGIAAMQNAGFEAYVGDAQALHLDREFGAIFAGELIEHLDNYQGFFDSVRRHLSPDGHLILTTPNAFRFTNFVYRLGGGSPPVNDDHMAWFCETTLLQLLERQGFEVIELGYVRHKTPGTIRSALARAMQTVLPEVLAESTLLVVAKPR